MDEHISRWILEFLLRHSTSDQLIKKLLLKLPVSNHDFLLKKVVLLRSIQSEISEASVSETVLDCLETLADLDEKEGLRISGSLKAAFCAVAVECTIKYLGAGEQGDNKFYAAAWTLWKGKVASLLAAKRELVATEEVKKWSKDIESAVWKVDVRRDLGKMNSRNEALRLVRVYLGEAWALLGPPFLDSAVARLRQLKEKESERQGGGGGGERATAIEKGKGMFL